MELKINASLEALVYLREVLDDMIQEEKSKWIKHSTLVFTPHEISADPLANPAREHEEIALNAKKRLDLLCQIRNCMD